MKLFINHSNIKNISHPLYSGAIFYDYTYKKQKSDIVICESSEHVIEKHILSFIQAQTGSVTAYRAFKYQEDESDLLAKLNNFIRPLTDDDQADVYVISGLDKDFAIKLREEIYKEKTTSYEEWNVGHDNLVQKSNDFTLKHRLSGLYRLNCSLILVADD